MIQGRGKGINGWVAYIRNAEMSETVAEKVRPCVNTCVLPALLDLALCSGFRIVLRRHLSCYMFNKQDIVSSSEMSIYFSFLYS